MGDGLMLASLTIQPYYFLRLTHGHGLNVILPLTGGPCYLIVCQHYLIGVARSVGFEPTSRTFVGWYTIHCANRVYIKLTDKVFPLTA